MTEKAKSSVVREESSGTIGNTSSNAPIMKNISPILVHQTLLSHTDVLNQMKKSIKTPSPGFQQYQDEIRLVHEVRNVNVNIKKSSIMKRIFHDNILNTVIMANNNGDSDDNNSKKNDDLLSPLFRLLIDLHEKIRALVPNRKDLHGILKDEYNNIAAESSSNHMMFLLLSRIIEAGKALSMLESKFQSEATILWIDIATNHHIIVQHQRSTSDKQKTMEEGGSSVVDDDISFLICSLLYLMEKTDRAQKEKDAFYFEHVISPYLFKNNNNSNNNDSAAYQTERNAMENKFNSCLPITRKWIQNMMMISNNTNTNNNSNEMGENNRDDDLEKCHNERRLFITKGWIESILFEEKHEIKIPEIFYLDVNAIRSIRNVTRLAVTGCALGLHAAIRALRGGGDNNNIQEEGEHQSYEEYIEDTMVGIAQGWAEDTATSSSITEDEIATLRGQTRNVLRGQDPVIQLMNNRMKSIFLELALKNTNDSSAAATIPHKIQSGRQKRINEDNLTENDDEEEEDKVTDHPIFVQNAEKVFCSRGLAFFAKDLARATLLSVKIPQLACNLYDKMILDIIQENVYESVD
ncbi:hypothetical protein FRACYDRAFT_263918 [Fragilariopsis cylindrus CCMP1102]|uniref:Uncharacterized protein n=1 Tax=Fragilariopsis cylindrus CCMP1102 TaxID=635003 RepID=A0A1E7EW26_9STRA|nr:hypothetical protein FRACYDRAFT_263918 [Fragilariopsis cylindrus CCMP1102]|eukprot:OEU10005.1 hypothetical protein FRACYDRAFT_263918 [Fragilariopsis cylindrus CCMP1102]